MIVAIIKTGATLTPVDEFRKATTEAEAVTEFCNENTPPLIEADYLGVNGDSLNLSKNWAWDFSEATPIFKEVLPDIMEGKYTQSEIDGRAYFKLAKAKYFGLRLQNGELNYNNLSYVYTRLSDVALRLNNGDQGLALHYLLNEFGIVTQTDIDNGYTQDVHDNIILDLTNYLTP